MANFKAQQKYEAFWTKHGAHHGIPDSGYCWSASGAAGYVCVPTKATARRGAQLLANMSGKRVDLVRVQGRGHDRSTIAEVYPKNWGALSEKKRREDRKIRGY